MKTGEIVILDAYYAQPLDRKLTPLTDSEHAAIEPLNRHERRAALVKLRREKRRTDAKSEDKT